MRTDKKRITEKIETRSKTIYVDNIRSEECRGRQDTTIGRNKEYTSRKTNKTEQEREKG